MCANINSVGRRRLRKLSWPAMPGPMTCPRCRRRAVFITRTMRCCRATIPMRNTPSCSMAARGRCGTISICPRRRKNSSSLIMLKPMSGRRWPSSKCCATNPSRASSFSIRRRRAKSCRRRCRCPYYRCRCGRPACPVHGTGVSISTVRPRGFRPANRGRRWPITRFRWPPAPTRQPRRR